MAGPHRDDDPAPAPARVALFFGWAPSPVWYRSGDDLGEVPLDRLPLSPGLRERLQAWNDDADRVLSSHDYAWPDDVSGERHVAEGSALARELRSELGTEVVYTPDGDADERLPPTLLRRDGTVGTWNAVAPLSGATFRGAAEDDAGPDGAGGPEAPRDPTGDSEPGPPVPRRSADK